MLAPLRPSSIPRGEARHWRKSRQIASCSVATLQGCRRKLSNLSVPSGRMIPATVWRASPRPAGFWGRMVVHLIEQDEADRNRIGKAFFTRRREDAKPSSPLRRQGPLREPVPRFQTGPCLRRGDGVFEYTHSRAPCIARALHTSSQMEPPRTAPRYSYPGTSGW